MTQKVEKKEKKKKTIFLIDISCPTSILKGRCRLACLAEHCETLFYQISR
jgi:hypothetical protein